MCLLYAYYTAEVADRARQGGRYNVPTIHNSQPRDNESYRLGLYSDFSFTTHVSSQLQRTNAVVYGYIQLILLHSKNSSKNTKLQKKMKIFKCLKKYEEHNFQA